VLKSVGKILDKKVKVVNTSFASQFKFSSKWNLQNKVNYTCI